MDARCKDILESLLANITVLDAQLLSLARSELFSPGTSPTDELIEGVLDACVSVLQTVQTIERSRQPYAFPVTPDIMARLE